ncbi:hypothetical protein B0H17DRAFT_1287465, partial [Mycena rosella]
HFSRFRSQSSRSLFLRPKLGPSVYISPSNHGSSLPRPSTPQTSRKMFSSSASDALSSGSGFGSASSSSMSSPASSRSSPVHTASLVDPANHSPALLQLVNIKLSRPVIEYVVDCVSETVDYAMGRTSPGRTRSPYHAEFI